MHAQAIDAFDEAGADTRRERDVGEVCGCGHEAGSILVMAGFIPAIHVLLAATLKDVDARHKAGHDELSL
jgi:hypothetical protein